MLPCTWIQIKCASIETTSDWQSDCIWMPPFKCYALCRRMFESAYAYTYTNLKLTSVVGVTWCILVLLVTACVCVCSYMLLLDATLCCNVLYGDVWCYVLDVQSCSGMQTVVVCCYMTSNTVVSCTMLLVGITWCSLVLLVTACMCVFLYVVVRCYLMQWCVEWGHTMSSFEELSYELYSVANWCCKLHWDVTSCY